MKKSKPTKSKLEESIAKAISPPLSTKDDASDSTPCDDLPPPLEEDFLPGLGPKLPKIPEDWPAWIRIGPYLERPPVSLVLFERCLAWQRSGGGWFLLSKGRWEGTCWMGLSGEQLHDRAFRNALILNGPSIQIRPVTEEDLLDSSAFSWPPPPKTSPVTAEERMLEKLQRKPSYE
jgi:hypothetical protein